MNRWTSLLALLALSLITSCQSERQKREAELAEIPTPLAHDPTDEFEIARWWTNGTHMLRLDDNAYYALYRGTNRYAIPLERGHWGKTSYAVLMLEPYDTLNAERIRVAISRVDGELALTIPKLEPMKVIDRPPTVIEDRLLGAWEGEIGVLRLNSDGTYTLTPHAAAEDQPVVIAGHEGTWSVIGSDVTLTPRTPGMNSIRMPFTVNGDAASLTGPEGPLVRRTTS
jgi:hypothetical protein